MALKNYTTSVSVEKTLSEIQGKLAYVGAKRIMTEYDDTGNVVALSFQLELNGQQLAFSLPTDWRPVAQVLERQRAVPKSRLEEQARRTAWRITKDWVDAQVAREILKAVNKLQIKTLEHWCFILRNNNFESSIKEMEQTLNQLKEYSETWNEERSENEN